ncbi:hypothetical protein THAOC_19627 [Thalassiosira oceanica]|uniref:Uncharacterized protein n=1 Tax=Thalassiosira oceanica TaxID=159749 RepID=K0S471_THAOC|nr:hypothetical protein THAOC_19627 [Thalassiosira oceanica]|eukprot:EJK60085.1 hypothetical protein THAOC_19627 [Thalassiosira oceanica]
MSSSPRLRGDESAKDRGGAPVAENEREAGPPADRAAHRPRSLRLPTPCSEVKILKMDEDGALTAGETPPPPPGLVAQSGAGHGARTTACHAVLLALKEAAEASAARGRRSTELFPETCQCQAGQPRQ